MIIYLHSDYRHVLATDHAPLAPDTTLDTCSRRNMFKRAHDPPLYNGALAKWRSTKKGMGAFWGFNGYGKEMDTGPFLACQTP
jgi:hypothetical protein